MSLTDDAWSIPSVALALLLLWLVGGLLVGLVVGRMIAFGLGPAPHATRRAATAAAPQPLAA